MNELDLLLTASGDSRAPKAIHFICHPTKLSWKNLKPVLGMPGRFISKCWIIRDGDPYSLIGGFLYLHEKSSQRAGFAGRILAVEPCSTDATRPGFAFTVVRIAQNGQPWRGETPTQVQHHGGIVDALFADEIAGAESLPDQRRRAKGRAKS
jgi:hypothetical protein